MSLREQAIAALDTVLDPELDEPITDLGFVRSVEERAGALLVHLRLPTSFCSPNFAYLMAADAQDALSRLPGVRDVRVELDDHHDSELINRGLARNAGYRGTFGSEALESLDELRATFRRKAHTAAMERALRPLLPSRTEAELARVTIAELPDTRETQALLHRRAAIGLCTAGGEAVLVDDDGLPCPPERAALVLRRARSVRISVDGNAHFCRGLLRTRYPDSGADQTPRSDDTRPLLPLLTGKANAS